MKTMSTILIGFVLVGGLLTVSMMGCVVTTVNKEISLKNQIRALSQANEVALDTMWKIIKQKAQVTDKFAMDRLSIYKELVDGRSGGTLFKSLQEANPQMDASLYQDLMNSIEGERKGFKRDQQMLVDVIRERKDLCMKFPSKFILNIFGDTTEFKRKGYPESEGWPEDYQYMFVTSSATKDMVDSGEENQVELF